MGEKRAGKVTVIGVGNELLRDEGAGVRVARELAAREADFPLEIIVAGTASDFWPGEGPAGKLVIVDAVLGGGEPGTIYRFSPADVEIEREPITSVHQIDLLHVLRLAEMAGAQPAEVVIIGIEPAEIGWGLGLSEKIEGRIPEIVNLVLKEAVQDRGTG